MSRAKIHLFDICIKVMPAVFRLGSNIIWYSPAHHNSACIHNKFPCHVIFKDYIILKLQNKVNFQCNHFSFNSISYRSKAYVTFLFRGALFITLGELLKFAATLTAITKELACFLQTIAASFKCPNYLSALSASALQRQKFFQYNYWEYRQLKCSPSTHFTTCGVAAASTPAKGEKWGMMSRPHLWLLPAPGSLS